jgi:hypothetical protein
MRRNESLEAQNSFRRSIQLKPDYALPHYELAKLLFALVVEQLQYI